MNREHTVTNGAGRMEECAEHVRAKFAAEGYETQKLTVSDPPTLPLDFLKSAA